MYCKKSAYLPLLLTFFLFFYVFNYFTPMAFGDDYVYSFVWEGHPMYEPLSEQVRRLSSFNDLFASQWSHYFTGNGRTVSHIIAQFFLWTSKDVFNVFNALISVLLIIEIYWCANKGIVSFDFRVGRLSWIFFALWAFTPGFSPVFFWLSGACNYLWSAVLLLGFLLPFVRKYYFFKEKVANNRWFHFAMTVFGIVAGWTNENSICWVILFLLLFIYVNRKSGETEVWMITGLAGLLVGYSLLILAPGNVSRLHAETGASSVWVTGGLIKTNLRMLAAVFFFQFLLWYFTFRSLFILQNRVTESEALKQEQVFVIILCILSFGMTVTMILSPNFPPRSSFPGTVQLIIATSVLLRIQESYGVEIIKQNAKKFVRVIGSVYFMLSSAAAFYGFYNYHVQVQQVLSFVKCSEQAKKEIVTVSAVKPVSETVANMSGFHILYYEMSEDANDWRNVAFSRYYGIKGIRMIKCGPGIQE